MNSAPQRDLLDELSIKTQKILFAVTFWGPWHTNAFVDVLLPSLLTEGNLPSMSLTHQLEFQILTTGAGKKRLMSSPLFAMLTKVGSVIITEREHFIAEEKFTIHHNWWNRVLELGKREGAFVALLPPDLCFSDGSLSAISKRINSGAAGIYVSGVRVVSETFMPVVQEEYFGTRLKPRPLSHLDLVKLSIAHSHPFNHTLYRGAQFSPYVAEMVLEPIKGMGWVKYCYSSGPIMFIDPTRAGLNSINAISTIDKLDNFHVVYDAREVGMVSLTPLTTYGEWLLAVDGQESTFVKALKSYRAASDISSAAVAKSNFIICDQHDELESSAAYLKAVGSMDIFASSIRTKSILMQITEMCEQNGMEHAADIISPIAAFSDEFPALDKCGRLTCFLPSNDALLKQRVAKLFFASGGLDGVRRLVAEHLFTFFPQKAGQVASLHGGTHEILITKNQLEIDGYIAELKASGPTIDLYSIDGVLPIGHKR